MRWRHCRNERWRAGIALRLRRSRDPAAAIVGTYRVRSPSRIADSGAAATLLVLTTVARHFREFYRPPHVYRRPPRRRAGIAAISAKAAQGRRSHQIQRARGNDRIRGHDPAHQGAARAGRGRATGSARNRARWRRKRSEALTLAVSTARRGVRSCRALARAGTLWQGSAACGGLFGRFLSGHAAVAQWRALHW